MKQHGKTPRDILRIVFRRRWLFVFSSIVLMLIILGSVPYWPRQYTGEAIFETSTDPASDDLMQQGSHSFEAVQGTLRQELSGRSAIEEALQTLKKTEGLPREPGSNQLTDQGMMMFQEMVREVQSRVVVSTDVPGRSVNYIRVRYTDSDPKLAQDLPNQLVFQYRVRKPEERLKSLEGSREFLLSRAQSIEKALRELEKQRDDMESKNRGIMPDSLASLTKQLEDLRTELRVATTQRDAARQRVAGLKEVLDRASSQTEPIQETRGPNPELQDLREQLRQSRRMLEGMVPPVGRMKEEHPDVIALRSSIEQMELRLQDLPDEVVITKVYGTPESVAVYRMQLAAAEADYNTRNDEIERMEARLAALEDLSTNYLPVRQQFHELSSQIARRQTEMEEAQEQLREIERHVDAEVRHRALRLQTIQDAQKQYLPSFPQLWHILAAAIIGGLSAGAGLVFLAHAVDRTVGTSDEADEEFGVPVCGVVSEIVTPRQRIARRLVFWGLGPAVTAVLMLAMGAVFLNAMLWLQYPEEYAQWRHNPLGYVSRQVDTQIDRLQQLR